MALIFPRLARNFVKNGYYPTDYVTMSRLVKALQFDGRSGTILDPCCGEGAALAMVRDHLVEVSSSRVITYGVEYDEERAWHAKKILDHCIHADLRDCEISIRQFGLLFLNPPYGDAVADKAQLSDQKTGRLRLEKEFYRRSIGLLQFTGVMILIIPFYTLDKEFSTWIARHFHNVKVFMAPEQEYKQCVIFGVKHKVGERWSTTDEFKKTRATLFSVGMGDIQADELPDDWLGQDFSSEDDPYYHVPEAVEIGRFKPVRVDAKQLGHTLGKHGKMCNIGLWKQHDLLLMNNMMDHKRPLCDVSDWHLSLMLAAGQVSGVVNSNDGRTFVVRGDTYKSKQVKTTQQDDGNGRGREVRTATDIFVPAIRGLDMTPGSKTFGEVYTIK